MDGNQGKQLSYEGFKERYPEVFKGKSEEEVEKMDKVLEPFCNFMGALFEMENEKRMEDAEMCDLRPMELKDTVEGMVSEGYKEG